ncbi:MAG TPA: CheB methylesterase domain-containing protein, partial [Anaerolineae bacterium]
FLSGLADWLGQQSSRPVKIASHGASLGQAAIWLAPEDYHLQINEHGSLVLSRGQAYKGLRPSANYLFHSLAEVYGSQAAGVILTGMGDDGADGLVALHAAGGLTIAQDEASCIVYGMPREAVIRQAIDQVLPLEQVAAALCQLAGL